MRGLRPLSSGAFRFAFLLASGFALGSAALLLVVAHLVDHYIAEGMADAVTTEINILAGEERELGRAQLLQAIERHEKAVTDDEFRYLLTDAHGRRLAGRLPLSAAKEGWHVLSIVAEDEQGRHVIASQVKGVRLGDGALLVVGADLEDLRELRWQLMRFTAIAGAALTVLALIGGIGAGGLFLRRLDEMNGAIVQIMGGRFSQRLPRIGIGPEFEELTTNLNAMLDRIEELMDGMRQVSVDVAHDLRTPLMRLRHRLEEMQATTGAPAATAEQLEACLAQTDEIIRLFSSLLRIGALESRTANAILERIDLSALLGKVTAAYAPLIEDEGKALTLAIMPGIHVRGDRDLLVQAISNLLENAIGHTPDGSRIAVRLAEDSGNALISVEDNGIGVPAEDRQRVLRRFVRLDRSRSTPGSGLGLALVAAIIRLHEGSIRLEDAAPGLRVVLILSCALHIAADRDQVRGTTLS